MRDRLTSRREGRELALQFLFQTDFNPQELDAALAHFWDETAAKPAARIFAEDVIRGVLAHGPEIDETIRRHAENWEIGRMGGVDRNVLRVAVYELLHRMDIPPVVSINEAVDIARDYAGIVSGRFVNGILDEIRKGLKRPSRTADSGDEASGA